MTDEIRTTPETVTQDERSTDDCSKTWWIWFLIGYALGPILLIIIFSAAGWPQTTRPTIAERDRLGNHALAVITRDLETLARALHFPLSSRDPRVIVVLDQDVPAPMKDEDPSGARARAGTRTGEGGSGGCTVTIAVSWARDETTLAHEACHCAMDYEVMKSGWDKEPLRMRKMREARAKRCSEWLTAIPWVSQMQRRMGEMPDEVRNLREEDGGR